MFKLRCTKSVISIVCFGVCVFKTRGDFFLISYTSNLNYINLLMDPGLGLDLDLSLEKVELDLDKVLVYLPCYNSGFLDLDFDPVSPASFVVVCAGMRAKVKLVTPHMEKKVAKNFTPCI